MERRLRLCQFFWDRRFSARRPALPSRRDVGAALHDARDLRSEALADLVGFDPRVLDRVVEQGRDRLVLAPTGVEHQRGDTEQV